MRICIITSSFPMNEDDSFAAAGKACKDFALELEKAGHEVFILAPSFSGEEACFGNLNITRFSWGGSGKSLSMLKLSSPTDLIEMIRFLCAGRKSCLSLIKENRVDRTIAMWTVPAGLFALSAWRRLGVPFHVWALGADIWVYGKLPLLKSIVRKVLRSAEGIYADGKKLCKDVKMLSGRECKFLPHLSKIDFKEVSSLPLDQEKTNFLFVGRWERPKGIDILIEAVRLLYVKERDFHLHIIGGGSLECWIKEKIDEYGLIGNVSLLGWVDQSLLTAYMKSCQVLITPSRVESIPCVYSEAMSAGIPVLVTDVGDMGVLTKEYCVGRVARPEDARSLEMEMHRMIVDDLEQYRVNTVKVAEQWSLPAVVSMYLADVKNSEV